MTLSGEMLYHMKRLEEKSKQTNLPSPTIFKKEQIETIKDAEESIQIEASSETPVNAHDSVFKSSNIIQVEKKEDMPATTKHLTNSKKKAFRGFKHGPTSVSDGREVAANFESIPDDNGHKQSATSVS